MHCYDIEIIFLLLISTYGRPEEILQVIIFFMKRQFFEKMQNLFEILSE